MDPEETKSGEGKDDDDDDDDDDIDYDSDASLEQLYEDMERGGPRGRSSSIERRNDMRNERDLLVFHGISKLSLQRVSEAKQELIQSENAVAGEIFRAISDLGEDADPLRRMGTSPVLAPVPRASRMTTS